MSWTPGNLILVGSRSWGGRIEYVLGNCIVNGTREYIPIGLFAPKGNRFGIVKMLMRMQLGSTVIDEVQFSAQDIKEYLKDPKTYIENASESLCINKNLVSVRKTRAIAQLRDIMKPSAHLYRDYEPAYFSGYTTMLQMLLDALEIKQESLSQGFQDVVQLFERVHKHPARF